MTRHPRQRSPRLPKGLFRWGISLSASLLFIFFAWSANTQATPPLPSEGEPIVMYSNQHGDDLKELVLGALRQAKKSVFIATFTLKDRDVIAVLSDLAKQGVSVWVVYDAACNQDLPTLLGPEVHCNPRTVKGLMHRKILVIDEKVALVGSANLTWSSLKKDDNLILTIPSHALAQSLWYQGRALLQGSPSPPLEQRVFTVDEQQLEWWSLPEDPRAADRLERLIGTAQKTIRVAMYTWTRKDLTHALIRAKARGIDVQVAIDNQSAQGAPGKEIVKELRRAGIQPVISEGSALLHHKLLVIDNTISVTGSANWTKAAFTRNEDDFLILSPLTPQQQECLEAICCDLGIPTVPIRL